MNELDLPSVAISFQNSKSKLNWRTPVKYPHKTWGLYLIILLEPRTSACCCCCCCCGCGCGCCWLLLVVVGCCWLLLVVVGCCGLLWVVVVVAGCC